MKPAIATEHGMALHDRQHSGAMRNPRLEPLRTADPTPGTDWTLAALRVDLHGFSAFYLLLLLLVGGGGRGKLAPKASTR